MRGSDVRAKIAAEHVELSQLLRRAGHCAYRALDGDAAAIGQLCASVLSLEQPLRKHFVMEEEVVPKILESVDGWGSIALLDFRVTHAHQREYLTMLIELARDPSGDPAVLAAEVIRFVHEMVKEMEREERELAHPDVERAQAVRTSVG